MKKHHTTPAERNRNKLQKIFPAAFTEGKIDWAKLKNLLQPSLHEDTRERYGLDWVGKQEAYHRLQESATQTLRPCPQDSVDFDTSQHLFIEGENLETLQILEKSYYGRVKMIYIDPPYNTGNDFIYRDRFQETQESYHLRNGEKNGHGDKNYEDHLTKNSKENGHYHSRWLSMIYPRLFLARNLLRDDGVIFVSIDDHEVHNLRLLMDEIFGEENFVSNIVWEKNFAPKNDNKYISNSHDYILVYSKNKTLFSRNLLPREEIHNSKYKNPDNDSRGLWTSGTMLATTFNENGVFPIEKPNGSPIFPPKGRCWRYSENKVKELLDDNRIWFGQNGKNVPRIKRFLAEMAQGIVPQSLWKHSEVGSNQSATQLLKSIFNDIHLFPFPKPVSLIKRMLQLATSPQDNDLILDFFAGSGTTAQAVMELNAEDGGTRKYICIQLPEKCDPASEAYQAGYPTIAAIARERIRRARQKIAAAHPGYRGDLGFKAFRQAPSHFIPWEENLPNVSAFLAQLKKHQEASLKPDTQRSSLLYELLLERGYPLHSRVVDQEGIYQVSHPVIDEMMLFLLEQVDQTTLELLLRWKPKPVKVFILDDLFGSRDSLKTNIRLHLEEADILFESF